MKIDPTLTIELGQYPGAFVLEALAMVAVGCVVSLVLSALWLVVVMFRLGSGQDGSGGDHH